MATQINSTLLGIKSVTVKLYVHHLVIWDQSADGGTAFFSCTVVNNDSTLFTPDSLAQWLYQNNLTDGDNMLQATGKNSNDYSTVAGLIDGLYTVGTSKTDLRVRRMDDQSRAFHWSGSQSFTDRLQEISWTIDVRE